MRLVKSLLVIFLIIGAVILGCRLFFPEDDWICQNGTWQPHGHPSSPTPTTPCVAVTASPSTSSTPVLSPAASTQNSETRTYINSKMGFSVVLPKDVETNENLDGTVTFSKWGPTQKVQTELFDGFSINIDQGTLGSNKNLLFLVQADIEQKKAQLSPNFSLIVEPIAYKKNGYYYLAEESSGEVAYFYVYQTSEKFLLVTATVKDPGKLGFKGEMGNIIDALTQTE